MNRFALAIMALLATGLGNASVMLPPIPHGSQSQIIHLPFFDYANPGECPATDVTSASEDFTLTVFGDKRGFSDVFTETDGTLEDITTMGTFATPTATKARFEVTAAGSCVYEVHLPDAAFAGTNDDRLIIEAQNGTSDLVLETVYQIDMTGVTTETAASEIWTTDISALTTSGTAAQALSVQVPAILTDTGTTLDDKIDALPADTATAVLASVIEDADVTPIDLQCALATMLATLQGEWTVSGTTATFEDPSGAETRVVQVSDASAKTSVTITCP